MAGKVSKEDSGYAAAGPHCGICRFFSGDNDKGKCKLVEGQISEDMICKLYQGKTLAESGEVY